MYEDDINDGTMVFEDIQFLEESKQLFETFSCNKKLTIDYSTVTSYLYKFDIMNKRGIFETFKPPALTEYFCQKLNFLLLIDFILTFFKIDNSKFNVSQIDMSYIFQFFVKLGEFFSFMNYLDVDDNFLNYLKYMITLYLLQLSRENIEKHFYYDIEVLDNFFANEVMYNIFIELNYMKINNCIKKIKCMDDIFKEELKSYNPTKQCDNYNISGVNLDSMFNISFRNIDIYGDDDTFVYRFDNSWDLFTVKQYKIQVPNPEPRPDPIDDDPYDYDYHDWTPFVDKYLPKIEESDINYKTYKTAFICKKYSSLKTHYDELTKSIKDICRDIKIKDYTKLSVPLSKHTELKVKIILNDDVKLLHVISQYHDNKITETHDQPLIDTFHEIYQLACLFGNLDIVKQYIALCTDALCTDFKQIFNRYYTFNYISLIQPATQSPNNEIFQYLQNNVNKYELLKKAFNCFPDLKNSRPKITFKK
jgi:hypothetical protein